MIKDNFIVNLDTFNITEIEKSDKSIIQKDVYISGYASLPTVDSQGEKILHEGIDFTSFIKDGYFNWDHSHHPDDILALPVEKGCFIDKRGFFVTGKMLNTPSAKAFLDLYKALKEAGKKLLGMSIEGRVLKRSEVDEKIIEKAEVKWVAITPRAVNKDTVESFSVFVKSLLPTLPPPDDKKAPVVKQSIEKEPKIQTYSVLYRGKEIITPDLFTFAVVELTLNGGLNRKEAEALARKFEQTITELSKSKSKSKNIDKDKVIEAGKKIYKQVFGDEFDEQKFNAVVDKAISEANDTEEAIGLLKKFLQGE